ncbi:MAG: MgtC/SapB family protein [Thermomicrobiales bacterium]
MWITLSEHMNWGDLGFGDMVGRLALATVLGLLIGIERERLERAAWMRTHALVCVAAALIMIVSTYGFPIPGSEAEATLDPSRIAAQVVSGVGFLGAGVIFMRRNVVRGLTTAASVWAVAGVGLAAGGGLYVPSTVGALFMLAIQGGLRPIERRLFRHQAIQHRVLITTTSAFLLLPAIQETLAGTGTRLRSIEFDRKGSGKSETVEVTVQASSQADVLAFVNRLHEVQGVEKISWRQGASMMRGPGKSGITEPEHDDTASDGDDEDDSR